MILALSVLELWFMAVWLALTLMPQHLVHHSMYFYLARVSYTDNRMGSGKYGLVLQKTGAYFRQDQAVFLVAYRRNLAESFLNPWIVKREGLEIFERYTKIFSE